MCSLQAFVYVKQYPKDPTHLKALVSLPLFFNIRVRDPTEMTACRLFWSGKSCTACDLNTSQLLMFDIQEHGHNSNILHCITVLSVHDSPLYKAGYH